MADWFLGVFLMTMCFVGAWSLRNIYKADEARVAECLNDGICPNCGHTGNLRFDSKLAGGLDVKWLPAWKCSVCWESFFEPKSVTAARIRDAKQKKADEFLEKLRKTAN